MPLSIHLIGPYPPPFGGVSTHLSRLRNRLLQDNHLCTVWSTHDDPGKGFVSLPTKRAAIKKLSEQEGLFHFHGKHYLAGRLATMGKAVLFTVHNERINSDLREYRSLRERWSNQRTRGVFKSINNFLAVSERARSELVRFGIPDERINVVPAYLPPDDTERAHPKNIADLIAFRQRFPVLLTSCAWAMKRYLGEDLYGIDLCVRLMAEIAKTFQRVGLVLSLPGSQGSSELSQAQSLARNLNVEDRILFLLETGAYFPLLKHCDLYLRTTNTDGFSITIAEAFEAGLPVIASDAVHRPVGCKLFANRNLHDLINKTSNMLSDLDNVKREAQSCHVGDCYQDILDIYHDLWRKKLTPGELDTRGKVAL